MNLVVRMTVVPGVSLVLLASTSVAPVAGARVTGADAARGAAVLRSVPGEGMPHRGATIRPVPLVTALGPSALCGAAASHQVRDDQPVVVRLAPAPAFTVGAVPSAWWRRPPSANPSWRLSFRGLAWVRALAMRAAQDGQPASLARLLDQVLAFYVQDPDPGTATGADNALANRVGWDEGTSVWRLQTLNCLYSLSPDPRLLSAMGREVAVQHGPRYYGPPRSPVHNHGVMADLAIVTAGTLTGRQDWVDTSLDRLVASAPMAFTASGTSREQSSSYQRVNAGLWDEVATQLAVHRPGAPSIAAVRAVAQRARRVVAWLTEPDGLLTVFGDARRDPGTLRPGWTGRSFRDDDAGVAVTRRSWSDPLTDYAVLRYGPRRAMHGQQDRGGVTWSSLGVRVLINPGRPMYDSAGVYAAYALGASAHNVAVPDDRSLGARATVRLVASDSVTHTSWQVWVTEDRLFGVQHTRTVGVSAAHRLVVRDDYPSRTRFSQVWHLDAAWEPVAVSADHLTRTFRAGVRVLTMTTTGSGSTAVAGVTRPTAGWWFPSSVERRPNLEITVRGSGTVVTTWTIR